MELEQTLNVLKDSDNYARLYNQKVEVMPLPSQIINAFESPLAVAKVGSPTIIEKEGQLAKSYSSYVLESKLEDNTIIEDFFGTVGVLVSNSQNKLTVYSGANCWACTNLSVFGAEFTQSLNLTQSLNSLAETIKLAEDNMVNRLLHIKARKEELEAKTYTNKGFEDLKGEIMSRIDIKLFDYVKHSETVLRDKNNIYYDMPHSQWKLLSSMTDKIKKESPSKRLESTLALEKIFV